MLRKNAGLAAVLMVSAACSDSPVSPTANKVPTDLTPALAVNGNWMMLAGGNGTGYWLHPSDPSLVVIGFGKDRAALAAYTGYGTKGLLDAVQFSSQLALFRGIAAYFGAPGMMGLFENRTWFARVRNGKKVGLWILVQMTPNRYNATGFRVRGVAQRPVNTHNPPAGWL